MADIEEIVFKVSLYFVVAPPLPQWFPGKGPDSHCLPKLRVMGRFRPGSGRYWILVFVLVALGTAGIVPRATLLCLAVGGRAGPCPRKSWNSIPIDPELIALGNY